MKIEDSQPQELDVREVARRIGESKGVVLDVRENDEVSQIAITGALHIPMTELQARVTEIPRNQEVYVLCHVGQRSAMVTSFLNSSGFEHALNVRGGIVAWLKAGLPVKQ